MLQVSHHSLMLFKSLHLQHNPHKFSKPKMEMQKNSHHLLNSHLIVHLLRKQGLPILSHINLLIATHSLQRITYRLSLKRLFLLHLTSRSNNKIRHRLQLSNQLLILSLKITMRRHKLKVNLPLLHNNRFQAIQWIHLHRIIRAIHSLQGLTNKRGINLPAHLHKITTTWYNLNSNQAHLCRM